MIQAEHVTIDRGGRTICHDVDLTVGPGEVVGIVGPNGSGKTTFLLSLNRALAAAGGRVLIDGADIAGMTRRRIARQVAVVAQESETALPLSVRDSVALGRLASSSMLDYGDAGDTELVDAALTRVDLGGLADRLITRISGGERQRAMVARAIVQQATHLLLDEPTNHLDAESVQWLEIFLQRFPGTVVAITHDRYFLDNAAEWILELDRGHGIPYKGNYSSWLEQKEARLKQEQKSEDARAKAIKKELEWARQNPKGRQAKSKARLARFEELSDYEYQKRNETQEIFIPVAERLGSEVIEFKGVSKSFGDRLLIDNLSFKVPAGAIVGIIGPNGAGKSTLFKLIAGKEQPDAGEVTLGKTVKMAFVDQSRDDLANDKTVWEDISGGLDIITVGKFQMPSRAYCGRFNFNGQDQQKKVGMLSGGERGRLHLAKTLMQGGNVLLLDEPSNDLDVETLRALEDALLEFAGSVMVISHDRWFLDRICTHILAAEGDSQWVFFDGNYQEYEADKIKRLGEEGARPHRMRYKALK